ncbi:50S ribosomal protein L24e [Candidatus Woesearchaeota archaeon]|nr:50S ribosomal protein L24e [Candidatus Woesearchaeota archaeon]HIH38863.1 50S ribosomal protein L24e [Candidatus Woesearchaeota archaeon]HIH49121.1 50S ribosomal protein L24e [Candidatus Woesearchaeota archaeon]HIJ03769.1 50S ribosomal protein L24e [Candidatus Woesearchaeota archaeon]
MARCDFCGESIPRGTGRMHVKNDGKILDFCSSKCRKNLLELKRNPLHTKWTARSRAARKPAQ